MAKKRRIKKVIKRKSSETIRQRAKWFNTGTLISSVSRRNIMPKELERKLKIEVSKKHPNWSKKRKDAYVFGTMRKTGWKPK